MTDLSHTRHDLQEVWGNIRRIMKDLEYTRSHQFNLHDANDLHKLHENLAENVRTLELLEKNVRTLMLMVGESEEHQ